MGMFDKFPYRNTRDLNLNWVIKKIIYLEGVVGEAVSDVAKFLSKKGGKMEGAIDMQSNRIFNLPTPAGDTDATSKKYVDDKTGNYLPLAGGTMTGAVNMGGNKITSVATPEADTDVATKKYVDDHSGGVSGDYLPLAGGTMTGSINMNGQNISGLNDPSEDTQAARKGYVDTAKAEANAYTDTKADLPKTVSGTVVTMNDASDASLQGLRVYGKTTQDGTPTPDNPVPLVSVGDGGRIAVRIGTSQEDTSPQTLNISTPNGLPGIPVKSGGNYMDADGRRWICDEVDFERGVYVQRVYKGNTDGLRWINERSDSNFYECRAELENVRLRNGEVMSSHFSKSVENKMTIGSNFVLYARFMASTGIDTIEKATAFFESNSVTFIAALYTPIETPIPENELAAYAALHTYKPNTTIYNDASAYMDVGYYTPNSTMRQSDIEKSMSEKLSKTGGTMTGAINMGNQKITNVPDPTAEQDVATKKYVDSHSGGGGMSGDYLPLSGGTMSGPVDMGNQKITNVHDPEAEQDVATKKYVDNHSGGGETIITYEDVVIYGTQTNYTQCDFRLFLPFTCTQSTATVENLTLSDLWLIKSDSTRENLEVSSFNTTIFGGNILRIQVSHPATSSPAYLTPRIKLSAGLTVRKI